jgi:hypothetical protein
MKKIKTYTEEVTVCDFCEEETHSYITCEICGKHACERCMVLKSLPAYHEIRLCPDCKDVDISAYVNKLEETQAAYDKAMQLSEEADVILESLKKQ